MAVTLRASRISAVLIMGVMAMIALSSQGDAAFTLRRGARFAIVCSPEEGSAVRSAADDLARVLEKALDAKAEVVAKPPPDCPAICLGTGFASEFGARLDTSPEAVDGYVLKVVPDKLLIAGASEYGTSNGVYGFLHEYVGARWFMPGQLFEVIPTLNELSVPDLDRASKPAFVFRIFSGVISDEGAKWQRRNRLDTYRTGLPYFGFGHNLGNIFPPSKYGETHPEYYSEINGKRFVPPKDGVVTGEPCFTNPEVIAIAAQAANEFFDKNPQATTFSLCVNDNLDFCRCKNCSALDSPRRISHGSPQYSESYFRFVKRVAEKVARKHPDKFLGCYAYWGVELPPRNIERLPDNVVIALTQDTSQHYDPKYKQGDRDLWLRWSKVAKHLTKYDYYGLGWITPRYFPTFAADDIKWISRHGAVGMYCEVYPYWSNTAPQIYMATRLLWDPSEDPGRILDEYYQKLFGPGAPHVKRFYEQLEKCWIRPRTGRWFEGLENMRAELAMVDVAGVERAMKHLSDAQQATMGLEQERVRYLQDRFAFTYLISKTYGDAKALNNAGLRNECDAAAIIGGVEEVLRGVAAAEKVYQTVIAADPLYQHTYYVGDRFEHKFSTWRDELRSAVQDALKRVETWTESLPDRESAKVVWDDLVSRLSANPVAERFELLKFLNPPMTCPKVSDLPDWPSIPVVKVDSKTFSLRKWGGEADCSAEFKIAWDEKSFHFRCAVKDDVHLQEHLDGQIWEQDCVQIAFDPLRNAWRAWGYGADDYEYGFALAPAGPIAWRWFAPRGKHVGEVKTIRPSITRDGDVTTYEIAIPWSELKPLEPRPGAKFGFSVLVNDDDGQGRGWMEWGGGIAHGYKDPRRFVGVVLAS